MGTCKHSAAKEGKLHMILIDLYPHMGLKKEKKKKKV